MTKVLAIPTIHLNGTSREQLQKEILDAARAVNKAISALEAAAPNGRDYYVQSPEAFRLAQTQHRDRLDRLQSVYDELFAISEAIHIGDTAEYQAAKRAKDTP